MEHYDDHQLKREIIHPFTLLIDLCFLIGGIFVAFKWQDSPIAVFGYVMIFLGALWFFVALRLIWRDKKRRKRKQ